MIIASAVMIEDGQIFVGKRHGDAQLNAYKILGIDLKKPDFKRLKFPKQGFITSDLRFLEREEALQYAKRMKQFRNTVETQNQTYNGQDLFSEDLW